MGEYRTERRGFLAPAIVVAMFCGAVAPAGATDKCGAVCDEAWELAGSPYVVTCDVTVAAGCDLTIGPGVTVRFMASTGLVIDGGLNVNGGAGSPAVLTSDAVTPAANNWNGLEFQSGSTGSISGADIRYAASAIWVTGATVSVTDSVIEDSTYGIRNTDGTVTVSGTDLARHTYGLYTTGGTLEVTGGTVSEVGSYGLYAGGASFELDGVTITGGSYGIYADNAATGTLTDVTVSGASYGLYAYTATQGPTTVVGTGCTLTGNTYGVTLQGYDSPSYTNPVVTLTASSIFDNSNYNYYTLGFRDAATSVVDAGGIWWGTTDAAAIGQKVFDRKNSASAPAVDWCAYLDGPPPGGVLAHNAICAEPLVCDGTVSWNVTSQPYLLTTTTAVCPTGVLEIGPGVEIRSATLAGIRVQGALNVNGTPDTPVLFHSASGAKVAGAWSGLSYESGSTGSVEGALIQDAASAIWVTGATVSVTDSVIEDSTYGIRNTDGTVTVSGTDLARHTYGLYTTGGTLEVTGGTVSEVGSYGLYAGGASFELDGVTITGGSYGIYADNAATGTLTDVTVSGASYGLYAYTATQGPTTVVGTGCTLTGNTYGVTLQGYDSPSYTNPVVTLTASSIFDNSNYNYYTLGFRDAATSVVDAGGIWWGTTDAAAIGQKVFDRKNSASAPAVDWCAYLDGPPPGGVLAHNAICAEPLVCDGTVSWNVTSQPYLLTTTTAVCPTGVLEIGPGVEIRSATLAGIRVQGALNVNGTPDTPVLFHSASGAKVAGAWSGLSYESGSTGSVEGALIQDAASAIWVTGATVSVTDSVIEDSTYGIRNTDGTVTVSGTDLARHTYGLYTTGGTLEVTGGTVSEVGSYGLYAGGASFELDGVTITGGSYGIYADNAATGTLTDVTVSGASYGLYAYTATQGPTTVVGTGCTLTGNTYGVTLQGYDSPSYTNPVVTLTASSIFDNSNYNYYTLGFRDAATSKVWAPDNWWGTTNPDDIAARIYDRVDNTSSPRVMTRPFGSICEIALGRDSDNDQVGDYLDNCPKTPNLSQNDGDGDKMGDACDPAPSTVAVGACDGVDDALDGYADSDGDQWGDPCDFQPTRADSYPGAPELCDGRDNDGDIAFGAGELTDDDLDGAVACLAEAEGDCDDTNAARFPCACERCGNLVDDDCNEATDGGDIACALSAYCVIVTPEGDALQLTVAKGACGGATAAGPYEIIRGFTTNLGYSIDSVELGNVACAANDLAWDRATDVSEDANPACNEGSVFWLARKAGAANFGTSSDGRPREDMSPDPPCP